MRHSDNDYPWTIEPCVSGFFPTTDTCWRAANLATGWTGESRATYARAALDLQHERAVARNKAELAAILTLGGADR